MRSPILVELEFGDVDFWGEWKTRERGESPSEQEQIQQQILTTYGTGPESNLGNIDALTTAPLLLPTWSCHKRHLTGVTTRCDFLALL